MLRKFKPRRGSPINREIPPKAKATGMPSIIAIIIAIKVRYTKIGGIMVFLLS